ncbi:pilus assembly protein [Massilia forsythiae]|uniref:Pilus assembly protein n=1 Tax=Massilia forsythiae TaxID=2728020 RepID=A0A7Z2VV65_9BURK|nr:TadE/TadG family type IV pilus assembly protein [Massilia forsythiae]QJD99825.1 pilus assembly protein [Massilia forsythiae]
MREKYQIVKQRFQRGVAAVEMAIVLPLLAIFVLSPSIFWSLYFYQYSVVQKAIHDAAIYLSTAPMLEMTTAGADGNPVALTIAKKIIAKELAGMIGPDLSIVCSYRQASGAIIPKTCSVSDNQDYRQFLVQIYMSSNLTYIDPFTGNDSDVTISPYISVSYVGN